MTGSVAVLIGSLGAGLILMAASAPASAQSGTPPILRLGQVRNEGAGRAVQAYGVGGLAGTRVQITVRVRGATDTTEVAFFTPAGEQMLSARGRDRVVLEVWLPLDDLFAFTVTRADSTRPMAIEVGGSHASVSQAYYHRSVGYTRLKRTDGSSSSHRCWIEPGSKYSHFDTAGNWTVVFTLRPDGSRLAETYNRANGRMTSSRRERIGFSDRRPHWEKLVSYEGREYWAPVRGPRRYLVYLDDYESDVDAEHERLGPYYGYLCSAPLRRP